MTKLGVRQEELEELRHAWKLNRSAHHIVAAGSQQHWLLDFRQDGVPESPSAHVRAPGVSLDPFLRKNGGSISTPEISEFQ